MIGTDRGKGSVKVGMMIKESRMAKVEVISEICKSCGFCIKVCPKGVLEIGKNVNTKGYQYAEPVNAENCIGCGLCATMCPDAAIEVYR